MRFLIGGLAYSLDDEGVRWLEQRIRATCVDASHRPLDADALACLQLADMLADDLAQGVPTEPIELSQSDARGLTGHVLGLVAAQEHGIESFYDALLRFGAEVNP